MIATDSTVNMEQEEQLDVCICNVLGALKSNETVLYNKK